MTSPSLHVIPRPVLAQTQKTDSDVLLRCVSEAASGDAPAFEQLVAAYGPRLYRFLLFRGCSEIDARDVLQDVLLVAWQRLSTLRDQSKFWPWVLGIASRQAADALKGRDSSIRELGDEAYPTSGVSVSEVRETLELLSPPLREVIVLRYLVGLTEREVAEALHIRVGTVKSRTARARRKLSSVLRGPSDQGGST